ncbi:ATP-binding protein [Nonomuraea diastatica]|uniref:ATP-binding protein n=1 Tax=Nonomuraea diastatica TaxID=1848329 RepID=A0A4R4WEJ5_9ACTN|nr:ATP-binding protein [Nonomuraea diastatica]TDD17438.1 ATP-binding protein [Nonomuraea diastatica]
MGSKEAQPYIVNTRLPEEMGSITASRQIVGEALATRGYQGRRGDVLLVVSELVTNALVHGDGPPSLRMRADASSVRIEVSDAGAELPRPREPGPGDGWGLHVVRLLSTGWGVAPAERGKTVWCELAADLTRIRPAEI